MMETGILILAAGNSSRFGEAKQLLNFKGKSLLRNVCEEALKITKCVVVVTGSNHSEISKEIENLEVTPNLFSSIKLRDLTLKNRIAVSPMQQYSSVDGKPTNWHMVHLGSRAVGGAGLIITECTAVSPEGLNTLSDMGLWNNEQVEAWKPIVKFVQEQGAKIAVQLWHAGGKGSHAHPNDGFKHLPIEKGGWVTKSSSPVAMDGIVAAELTIDEIEKIKNDFVQASLRAIEAGFNTIELHAGHG
ncbi:MAG: hypothetical protein EOO20_17285, partial [Chryseobacterium sp.]